MSRPCPYCDGPTLLTHTMIVEVADDRYGQNVVTGYGCKKCCLRWGGGPERPWAEAMEEEAVAEAVAGLSLPKGAVGWYLYRDIHCRGGERFGWPRVGTMWGDVVYAVPVWGSEVPDSVSETFTDVLMDIGTCREKRMSVSDGPRPSNAREYEADPNGQPHLCWVTHIPGMGMRQAYGRWPFAANYIRPAA